MRPEYPDDRAVSTQLSHVFGIAMTALLITVILTGAATHVQNQRSSVVQTQLDTIGNRLASEIERVDALGRQGGTVSVETTVQSTVSGQNYDVQLAAGTACDTTNFHTDSCLVLEAVSMPVTTRVPLNVSDRVRVENQGRGSYLLSVAAGPSEERTLARVNRPLRIGVGQSFEVNPFGSVIDASNRPPIARFRFSPGVPRADVPIEFSATRSVDADGDIVAYKWDFDADGTFEALGENVERELDPGPHRIRLQVEDDDGATSNVTRYLRVSGLAYESDLSATADGSGGQAAINFTVTNHWNSSLVDGPGPDDETGEIELQEILIDPKDDSLGDLDNECDNDAECPFGNSANRGEVVINRTAAARDEDDQYNQNVYRDIPEGGIIVELDDPVSLFEDESAEMWIGGFVGASDLDDTEFEIGIRYTVDGQTNSTVFTDVVGSPNVEEFWIRAGGGFGSQVEGMVVADRKLGRVEVDLGGDLGGTYSSGSLDLHLESSSPGEYVYALPLGDLDTGIVKANLTVAEGTAGIPAFETRGPKSINRSIVILDGPYVWGTADDWDNATLNDRVVHDSVGDRRPAEVRLGYATSDQGGSNLVGYWPLDESGNDASGTGNDALERGNPSRGFGLYGTQGYVFDGEDDYLEVDDDPSLGMSDTDEVTVSMWVNKFDDQSDWIALFQHSDQSYNLHFADGDHPTFTIHDDTWRGARDGQAVETDQWYHIVGTFDGSTVTTYVNGEVGDTTSADFIRESDMNVGIAENLQENDRHFDGKIDEIRVYDRALSESEVQDLSRHRGQLDTGWKSGTQTLGSNATLQYNAEIPSSTGINVTVLADTDGDGDAEYESDTIDLEDGQRSAPVDGLGNTTSTRFKLRIRFHSETPIKTPVLRQIGLREEL